MATLPDLPTNDAGFVAYYNGLDNGANTVEPTNMLDIASLGSYQQYDNGIRATYVISRETIPNFALNVRAKTDGWVVVWQDKEEQFYGSNLDLLDVSEVKTNSGDFFYEWSNFTIPNDTNYNVAMKDVSQEIFGGVDYSYSVDDASLYHYNYTNSTATSVVYFSPYSSGSFSYPTTIDRKLEAVNSSGRGDTSGSVTFDGIDFTARSKITCLDMIAEGLTPDAGTNYSVGTERDSMFILTGVFSQ